MNGQSNISVDTIRRRVLSLPTLLALLVGGGMLAVIIWRVFDFDWNELWAHIRGINIWLYILAGVLYYLSFWFRGLRWRLIAITANADHEDGKTIPGSCSMGAIILMGWFANSVAFLRLGDALRGWTLSRESNAPFPTSLGTVLAERVQDMVAVLVLVAIAAIWVTVAGHAEIPGAVLVAALALVVVLITGLIAMRIFGLKISRFLPNRLQEAYERFQEGTLDSFKSSALPAQMGLGIIGWMLEIARFYFVAQALGLDIGFGVVMFAALANAILTTIPTPGGFGFVEGGLTILLVQLGMGETAALSLTVVDRSISWLSVVVIGGTLFFIWQGVKRKANSGGSEPAAVEQTPGPEPG